LIVRQWPRTQRETEETLQHAASSLSWTVRVAADEFFATRKE
jgi:hypothetical protein